MGRTEESNGWSNHLSKGNATWLRMRSLHGVVQVRLVPTGQRARRVVTDAKHRRLS